MRPAPFLLRCAALVTDLAMLFAPFALFNPILMILYLVGADPRDPTAAIDPNANLPLIAVFAGMLVAYGVCYFVAFAACSARATPGKMLFGLQMSDRNGNALGWGASLRRALAALGTCASLGLGYLVAVADPHRRALHDRLCDTRVSRASGEAGPAAAGALTPMLTWVMLALIFVGLLAAAFPLCVLISAPR